MTRVWIDNRKTRATTKQRRSFDRKVLWMERFWSLMHYANGFTHSAKQY